MPILAIYALMFAAAFGGGYGACWSHMTSEIAALRAQIQLSNEDAKRKLLEAITSTERAEQAQRDTNAQWELERDKNIQINNSASVSLAATRMYIPAKHPNCGSSLPKSTGSPEPIGAADTTELPNDLEKLLRSEALRADNLSVYANECHQFVINQCGIK